MKPLNMQKFMSNRTVGKISIGWRKELNIVGIDDYFECALTGRSAIILFETRKHLDLYTSLSLHFTDELLD